MMPAVEASAISVRIGASTLLHDVSLSLEAGTTVAVVGPNGAGKSTLLRTLAGELKPSSGTVRLKGRRISSYSAGALALHRAVLSQSISVAFPFTVADIVRMGAGERAGPAVAALVEAALAEVDLEGFRDRIIMTLSGGEQQRAQFARILVQVACGEAAQGPGVLLLDEPTASLDLRHQLDVLEIARRCAARGVTVVAILHDLNLAALFAERVIVLDRGHIAGDGPPSETITDAILEDVFGVAGAVGRAAAGLPTVLPHAARPAGRDKSSPAGGAHH
ncbi:MAG: heme ABC transporter ATP-binding protein [Rhizobiales bacterium]|nr:heme ABC transporter ATP-binding protein [Hyphomicrobiales bacterium]